MDVAFIEHAQNDIYSNQCGENQQRLVLQGREERFSRPLKTGLYAGWQLQIAHSFIDPVDRLAKRRAWPQSERNRSRRALALTVYSERHGAEVSGREGTERQRSSRCGTHINVSEIFRRLLELRVDLQHHTVLVHLSEHCRDLPLAESVVKRVIEHLRCDT